MNGSTWLKEVGEITGKTPGTAAGSQMSTATVPATHSQPAFDYMPVIIGLLIVVVGVGLVVSSRINRLTKRLESTGTLR